MIMAASVAALQTKAMWYFTRGSGAVSFILLTVVFVLVIVIVTLVQQRVLKQEREVQ